MKSVPIPVKYLHSDETIMAVECTSCKKTMTYLIMLEENVAACPKCKNKYYIPVPMSTVRKRIEEDANG